MTKIVILASGNGSNAESIIRYAKENKSFDVGAVLSDNPRALVLDKAANLGCDAFCLPVLQNEKSKAYNLRLAQVVKRLNPDLIVLAGFMRILFPEFLNEFFDSLTQKYKVINIHPSLLPKFPGKDSYERAYSANETESGCTIHYVDEGIDTGKIIFQKKFNRYPEDSFEEFKARGLKIENEIYPIIIEKIIKDDSLMFESGL